MRPAISVLLLTTLIGAGQGLFLFLFAAQLGAALAGWPAAPDAFTLRGTAVAVALLAAGLAASFFHLGRPARAWRSASQWRSSWLSREVIALPLCMGLMAVYALAHHPAASALRPWAPWLGMLAALAALALFVCTGMIYACVRFLQEWASPLTVVNFVLFGCASGAMLATVLAALWAKPLTAAAGAAALALTALGLLGRLAALARNARLRPRSTLATAIGIKHPRIEQVAAGFLGGAFNTREFFHGRSAGFVSRMRGGYLALAFVVPSALLGAGLKLDSAGWLAAAFGAQYLGLLGERWHFFAEARHPQNLYYRAVD